MIANIKTELTKELKAIIDDQEESFTVYKIIQKNTHIINEKNINTNLYEPINIHMLLYAFYKENINVDYDQINENTNNVELIEQGNVIITIETLAGQEIYQENYRFQKGLIKTTITKKLPINEYILTVKYQGNKYYEPAEYKGYFTVSKRQVICRFNDFLWEAMPDEEIEIEATLLDKLNKNSIKNVYIKYIFDGSSYITKTDESGHININIVMPSVGQCSQENVEYPLEFYIEDDDTYILEETIKYISVIKHNTTAKIFDGHIINNQLNISGNVFDETLEYVKCGELIISVDNTNIKKTFNVENGLFDDSLDIIQEGTPSTDDFSFIQQLLNTVTTLTVGNSPVQRNYKNKHYIDFKATVIEESTGDPASGMVSFIITNKNTSELVYKYVTELDNEGEAFFNFYVSKIGEYTVQVQYHKSFFFKESQSPIYEYKVEEST